MAARMYSLYQKQNGRFVRISRGSYPKGTAVRVYQSLLLASCMSGCPELRLKPAKEGEPIGEMVAK